MTSQSQLASLAYVSLAPPEYTDGLVGLDKYKVGEEYTDRILKGTNFWIITYAKEPYIDTSNRYNSGKAYTTEPSTVKWCLQHKQWPTQGYTINLGTGEESLKELKVIIEKLDAQRKWFGCFWPNSKDWTEWCPWGMSLNRE